MEKQLIPSIQMLDVVIVICIAALVAIQNDLVLFAGAPICEDDFAEDSYQTAL